LKKLLNLLILLPIINACTNDEHRIHKVLSDRWKALETKNIELYSECISQEYPGREELIKRIEKYFDRIESIQIQPQEPAIYINNDIATVYQEIRLIMIINNNKQDLNSREKLLLKKTRNGWKIFGGLN